MTRKRIILTLVWLASTSGAANASVWYVDDDAPAGGDGTSWALAFTTLQDALTVAVAGDEILVAQGTYRPDERSDWPPGGTADRTVSFDLPDGVTLRGGYAGPAAPDLGRRDALAFETVLSGDLLSNDQTTGNTSDNSYHVLRCSNASGTTVLEGLTVSGGHADGAQALQRAGGGMLNTSASPTVIRCLFVGNMAALQGGGMSNLQGSSPNLTDCDFVENSADYGGGMANLAASSPTLTRCRFTNNAAGLLGGAIYCYLNAEVTLVRGEFRSNQAGGGGAIRTSTGCQLTASDCVFAGNLAASQSGGLLCYDTTVRLDHCSFANNEAPIWTGAAVGADSTGQPQPGPSLITMTNCILWDMAPEVWNNDGSTVTIAFSDVFGGAAGLGNIAEDPQWADPGDGDVHLTAGSPCIDAGDPGFVPESGETDLDGEARVADGRTDMGADEFHDCNHNGLADYLGPSGDQDGDCDVDLADFVIFANCFGSSNTPPAAGCDCSDLDSDGDVDLADFVIFAGNFGATDCQE